MIIYHLQDLELKLHQKKSQLLNCNFKNYDDEEEEDHLLIVLVENTQCYWYLILMILIRPNIYKL